MSPKSQTDSVAWMRAQWEEHGEPSPSQFAAMASILRTSVVVTGAIDQVLKRFKMTRTAYLVMVTLQMSREETRPLGQLSKALLVHPTTVTMVVDQLEKTGLVARAPHPSDRRTILARLTEEGHDAVRQASAALAEVGFGLGETGEESADRLAVQLREVREALGDFG
ncbi:MarR family transcriptional regulator [Streptomyces sp. NPDC026672]|uniref:MarR family transcriptional regulator n=1 Tax=unclassified Streptomyces TaxID=2593676 RepID=UPI0033D75059